MLLPEGIKLAMCHMIKSLVHLRQLAACLFNYIMR